MERPVGIIDYSVDGVSGGIIQSCLKVPSVIISAVEGESFPSVLPDDYRAVIHSGSSHSIVEDTSFIHGATAFVQRASEAGVSQMGICYGHQLLARAMVGFEAVAKCSSIELGWCEVDFLSYWPSQGVQGRKRVWQSHYDCVIKIPPGSVVTATNAHTKIQAFTNRDMKLFGTQFHPEFDGKKGNEAFVNNTELFKENNISLETVLESGPGFQTVDIVFNHFLKTFEQE